MDRHRVIRSAGLVGGLTLVSRGLGFIRDILMASMLGTTMAMSAFTVAFRMPNLFRALFGEGALSAAFIPVFVETRQKQGDAEAWRVARQVFTLVGLTLAVIVVASIGLATVVLVRGGSSDYIRLVWELFRIMAPYMLFICLAAVSMGVLNAFGHFLVPAATPWILNLVLIAAMVGVIPRLNGTPETQVFAIAWAVLLAGVLQWAAQLPSLLRRGFNPRPTLDLRDARLLKVLALMGPAALGRAVTQVNVLIDGWLAVAIAPWAPSALYYSERIIYLPMGIFATALSTVLLPLFSGQAARGDHPALRDSVNHALRLLMFVMIPAATGLLVLATPLCRAMFEHGAFTAESTLQTARALWFYAPGMVVFSLGKVFAPVFFAMHDTRTPVRVGVATVLLNIVLSITFMLTWPAPYKHAGIAFATVIAETLNGIILGAMIHRRIGSPGWSTVAASVGRILGYAGVMALAARQVWHLASAALLRAGWMPKAAVIGGVTLAIATGMVVYLLLALATRAPELAEIRAALRRRKNRP